MRRVLRWLGTLMIIGGVGALAWTLAVWKWQDPFTYLWMRQQQNALAAQYDQREASYVQQHPRRRQSLVALRRSLAVEARRYRRTSRRGEAIARLRVPKLGLDLVVVNGTDTATLKRGPGRHLATFMPGEGKLVYVAGHRTTYGAPFSHIDKLRRGDKITVELPYARFDYGVTGRRIVRADYVRALESRGREEVALQACWPRFFASHRIIVYAKPLRVMPAGARQSYSLVAGRAA